MAAVPGRTGPFIVVAVLVVMAEKQVRTDELLEALMLRMDSMDQAIASLKALTSSSGAGAPSSEAKPPAPKRVRGQRKGKGPGGRRAEATPAQVGNGINLDSTQPKVSASPVVDAGHAAKWGPESGASADCGRCGPYNKHICG
ncbi:hypothetical protein NDU88_003308 [Pleurodeles waltl]|uniref:Uncharacterized protein n=1 Tax=Pleurodeles waltl TaxID=8319 RepID=A0AAV7L1H1_PLEWA|nr:hypothetical protein NDU88_003308 [Pleurodeles waltl]